MEHIKEEGTGMEAGGEGFRETQHRAWDMGQRLDYSLLSILQKVTLIPLLALQTTLILILTAHAAAQMCLTIRLW